MAVFEVPAAAPFFPVCRHPVLAAAIPQPAAVDPHVAVAIPAPITRRPDIAYSRSGHNHDTRRRRAHVDIYDGHGMSPRRRIRDDTAGERAGHQGRSENEAYFHWFTLQCGR
jgi:hypothetical protein